MGKTPLQPEDKYVLRMPDGMRQRIKAAAESNGRSMNAEMVARLEDSFVFEAREQRLQSDIRRQGDDNIGLQDQIEEMDQQIKRQQEREVNYLAEIRSSRIAKEAFDKTLEHREFEINALRDELREVWAIMRSQGDQRETMNGLREQFAEVQRAMVTVGKAIEEAAKGNQGELESFVEAFRKASAGLDE
ncbi:Arc family DNA-binding protein [Aliihoeflea sp. PC F10.4]